METYYMNNMNSSFEIYISEYLAEENGYKVAVMQANTRIEIANFISKEKILYTSILKEDIFMVTERTFIHIDKSRAINKYSFPEKILIIEKTLKGFKFHFSKSTLNYPCLINHNLEVLNSISFDNLKWNKLNTGGDLFIVEGKKKSFKKVEFFYSHANSIKNEQSFLNGKIALFFDSEITIFNIKKKCVKTSISVDERISNAIFKNDSTVLYTSNNKVFELSIVGNKSKSRKIAEIENGIKNIFKLSERHLLISTNGSIYVYNFAKNTLNKLDEVVGEISKAYVKEKILYLVEKGSGVIFPVSSTFINNDTIFQ